MAQIKELKTLNLDIDKGICEVNVRDISKSTSELKMEFSEDHWSLVITEDTVYTSDPRMLLSRD